MSASGHSMRILYRCFERWGFAGGLRVWWGLDGCVRGAKGAGPRRVKVPGYVQPVWLRPGTSDVQVFERNFLQEALNGREYPQDGPLSARANAMGEKAVIVDGGANIGLSALWFARKYPLARIYAVEPDAENMELLRRNTASYPNIVPIQAGLWDRRTTVQILNPDADPYALRICDASDVQADGSINALTINDLMEQARTDELLIVKLLIQGAEKAVFSGNVEWLEKTWLVILMPNDWADPKGGAGRTAMSALSRQPFDWIIRNLCVFCYRYAYTYLTVLQLDLCSFA